MANVSADIETTTSTRTAEVILPAITITRTINSGVEPGGGTIITPLTG